MYLLVLCLPSRSLFGGGVVCSGGMNGFFWLSERNGLRIVVPSSIHGLDDIVHNKIL